MIEFLLVTEYWSQKTEIMPALLKERNEVSKKWVREW